MRTDLTQLINFNFDGLNFMNMGPNSIWWSDLSPVQFVPAGQILPSKYHTRNRRQFWFSEQIAAWINQNNYWNPWQCGNGTSIVADALPLQFWTNGLTTVNVKLYSCAGALISTTALALVSSPAVVPPYNLFQGFIDLSVLANIPGGYYLDVVAGAGLGASVEIISEGLNVQQDWPNTLLFEYTHSVNKQTMIFDTGFQGVFRVKGQFDNTFKQKYKGAFYVDEPQDISILNAISYEIAQLTIIDAPDYVSKKVANILLLDGTMIEGEGFSLDEGAEWEEVFTVGAPKKWQKINIRPAKNANGYSAVPSGADNDSSMMITLDIAALAPNAGNAGGDSEIINVTIS